MVWWQAKSGVWGEGKQQHASRGIDVAATCERQLGVLQKI
jgi:hypothetical protein